MAVLVAMGLGIITSTAPAVAGQTVYIYAIMHPFYGEIGTLTNTINRNPEWMQSEWRLRVAVKLLGIVVYRQESDTTEIMQGSRLVSLRSATDKDGRHFEVHGEAQGNNFVVNAVAGAVSGPASITPSDPWALKHTGAETVVYMDTGRIIDVRISGGDYGMLSVNGISVSTRHFIVTGDKQQDVWLDNANVPVMFRTVENGTSIDFVLQDVTRAGGPAKIEVSREPASAQRDSGNK